MQPDDVIAQPRINSATVPFQATIAFRRYGTIEDPDFDAPEDLYLRALIEEQGFDGLPHVLPARDLERYVRAGERELFRGVARPEHARAFRQGRFFVGRGVYAGGANAAAGPRALAIAREYAGGGVILRLMLKAGAQVADFEELDGFAYHRRGEALAEIEAAEEREIAAARAAGRLGTAEEIRSRHHAGRPLVHAQYDDIGRLATYLGYDAVHAADPDFYAVLDRTAVRVQLEDLR
jgi:hypothetical protein